MMHELLVATYMVMIVTGACVLFPWPTCRDPSGLDHSFRQDRNFVPIFVKVVINICESGYGEVTPAAVHDVCACLAIFSHVHALFSWENMFSLQTSLLMVSLVPVLRLTID